VGPKGIAIFDATGVVIQNCYIHNVDWNTVTGDNTDGIRIERSDRVVIRNNEISDIDAGSAVPNSAGVKLYDTTNIVVENNYLHDWSGSGLFDKRGGVNNTYRYNLITNVIDGFAMNDGGRATDNLRFHNNILQNVQNLAQTPDSMAGAVAIYSNTFAGYKTLGIGVRGGSTSRRYSIYNNIFVRSSSSTPMGEVVVVDTAWLAQSNYNIYPVTPLFVTNQYLSNQTSFASLSSWQGATSHDLQSRSANVDFVNAGSGDFRLATSSSLRGTARVGGVTSGAAIDPGAYSTGNEVIGPGATVSSAAPTTTPVPPSDVRVD
jgi:parallel beta-helix repeat protein